MGGPSEFSIQYSEGEEEKRWTPTYLSPVNDGDTIKAVSAPPEAPLRRPRTDTLDTFWPSTDSAGPDLVLDPLAVSNSTPHVGSTFRLSTTVRNQGTGRAEETRLHYYESTDATILPSIDRLVGTRVIDILERGWTSDEYIRVTAPSSRGTY